MTTTDHVTVPGLGPVPAWYVTLRDVVYDENAPEEMRGATAEAISAYGALRLDRRELYTEMAKRDIEWRAQRAAVLALHRSCERGFANGDTRELCSECDVYWPCATARALGVEV